jgi:hypothetical protein
MIKTEVFGGYGAGNDALDAKLNKLGWNAVKNLAVGLTEKGNTWAVLVYEVPDEEAKSASS